MGPKFGTVVRSSDRAILEANVTSGLDWLMLDGEHPGVGTSEMQTMLSVVAGRLPCYARVRTLDNVLIDQALDAGATGVIIPNVDTVAQAEESVRCVRHSRRPTAKVVVQAESAEAVRNIAAVTAVPGIEWVLIGPNDLTRSLGVAGQFDHPAYEEAISVIEATCRSANLPIGIFGMTPERVQPFIARGFAWLVTGIDRPR